MDANKIKPKDIVLASQKLGQKDAEDLAGKATKIMVFKGKKLPSLTVPTNSIRKIFSPC